MYIYILVHLISSLFVESLASLWGIVGILLGCLSWFHLPYGRFRAGCTCCGSADAITSTESLLIFTRAHTHTQSPTHSPNSGSWWLSRRRAIFFAISVDVPALWRLDSLNGFGYCWYSLACSKITSPAATNVKCCTSLSACNTVWGLNLSGCSECFLFYLVYILVFCLFSLALCALRCLDVSVYRYTEWAWRQSKWQQQQSQPSSLRAVTQMLGPPPHC